MRKLKRLSAQFVATAADPGLYPDGGGLWLQVTASRAGNAPSRSWIFRYTQQGRTRNMGLGPIYTVSLAEARRRAAACRLQLRDEIDPLEARHAERARVRVEAAKARTFRQDAEAYIAAHEDGWKNSKHRAQWTSTLETYALPGARRPAGRGDRHGAGAPGARADLAEQDRDGEPGARPDRGGARLGDRARPPRRRQPGALARPSRQAAAEALQGGAGGASRGAALRRAAGVHGGAAPAGRDRRPRPRVHHPDRGAHGRGDRRQLVGDRPRGAHLDGAGRAHEGRQGRIVVPLCDRGVELLEALPRTGDHVFEARAPAARSATWP